MEQYADPKAEPCPGQRVHSALHLDPKEVLWEHLMVHD